MLIHPLVAGAFCLLFLAGYFLGRIGHYFFGDLNSPHHWIYGLAIVIAGFFFSTPLYSFSFVFFGTGHFISDLNDFLDLKFMGKDPPGKKNLLGFD